MCLCGKKTNKVRVAMLSFVHPSLPIPREYFWNSGVRWETLVRQYRYLSRTYQHIS